MRRNRIALLCLTTLALVLGACRRAPQGDPQCSNARRPAAVYANDAKSANEFLKRGDDAFDGGNCNQAIAAYSRALALNPNYAEAYNNRAYTYMRMHSYASALQDLDQALRIRPDYIHALMNRGDIHNYYFDQDRKEAIADYDR